MRSRVKKVVTDGKGVQKGQKYNGPMANANRSLPPQIGEKKAELEQERRVKLLREAMAERAAIKADPDRLAEQQRINQQAYNGFTNELRLAKAFHETPDEGTLLDYSFDYVPLGDDLQKELQRVNNRKRISEAFSNNRK